MCFLLSDLISMGTQQQAAPAPKPGECFFGDRKNSPSLFEARHELSGKQNCLVVPKKAEPTPVQGARFLPEAGPDKAAQKEEGPELNCWRLPDWEIPTDDITKSFVVRRSLDLRKLATSSKPISGRSLAIVEQGNCVQLVRKPARPCAHDLYSPTSMPKGASLVLELREK